MRCLILAGALVCAAGLAGAATIIVEQATEYQTIDGFGGFGPMKVWWDSRPYYNDLWVNRIVDTLGLTMLRTTVSASFEYTNDNSDAFSFNRAACNISSRVPNDAETHLGGHFPYYRAMKAALEARGEQLKLIASIWTPPAWMKTNNDIRNGGNLRTDMYDEFAERCVEYVKVIKDSTGIDLYALSLQNEPAFVEPYESCVYDQAQLRDAVKRVGPRLQAAAPATTIFAPEDVIDRYYWVTQYVNTICGDAAAKPYIGALAVHGYAGDGVTPSSGTVTTWQTVAGLGNTHGKRIWMTETSGYSKDWTGGMSLAKGLYVAITYGRLSGATYWYMCDDLFTSGNPNGLFYALASYYRFARPGAVVVRARCADDADVLVTAFRHKTRNTLAIVIVNQSSSAKTATVTPSGGLTPSEYQWFRSSATERCQQVGTFAAGGQLALPALSVTSLYSGSGSPVRSVAPAGRPARQRRDLRTYGIDGRLVDGHALRSGRELSGAYVCRLDGRGMTVVVR